MTAPTPLPAPTPRAAAVVVAAGRGERLGFSDKVLLPLAGQPMIAYALTALEQAASINDVVVVVGAHTREAIAELVAAGPWRKVRQIVDGGARRQDSVALGVATTPASAGVVVVHDGARPLATAALFDRCVAVAAATGAAIAAIPVTDTLKRVAGAQITTTVSRQGLWAAQTPQAFQRALLLDAIARGGNRAVTDEAALCEALAIPVSVVPGSPRNLKITRPDDIPLAEALLRASADAAPASRPAASPDTTRGPRTPTARTGIGYDAHRLVAGRPLMLGGVVVPHARGLDGHSDADVLLHAIADALLGAAGLGDIGRHFPPGDARFKDADSRSLLRQVCQLLKEAGYQPLNVDATVIAEAPRLSPHIDAMRAATAACLGLPDAAVGIKATTNEGMGFVGRAEGIAALATATIGPAGDDR
ncbi:MAG: 2-C-methyl-D-erythritol 4-phosphate cytidylyltransferase [Chloroflexota bacterium]|nr:2-C-methyl-D-erythritol 4-phosphate cytidylyltransferase [Chloroflexota bacterium]